MPWPLLYNGGQDDDQTRSIDNVHIEPSIREGVHLVPSLYGKDASRPLYRFTVTNLVPPFITGDPKIPNVLTCNLGQWAGSPIPLFDFQWMSNGADIPGANSQTWLSDLAYDNTVITCEVRGYNLMGEAYALTSNSVPISIIEPINIGDMDFFSVGGLSQEQLITLQNERTMITTGLAAENRQDINRAVAYLTTGLAADQRSDINTQNLYFVQGLERGNTTEVLDSSGLLVVNYPIRDPLVDGVPVFLPLKNHNAEMGMAGWEIFGASTFYGGIRQDGYNSWWGGANVDAGQQNIPYSYMWQDIVIPDAYHVDVDANDTTLELTYYQRSYAGSDQANVKLEFYDREFDGTSTPIQTGSNSGIGLWASPSGIFFRLERDYPIPPNTRVIRIIPEFNLQAGTNNDAFIDNIQPYIRKGDRVNNRDFGPNFEQWRMRFTEARTWSGGGLSELEFRDISGGADLSTGGSPIFGSAGLGVANADYAFDDIRNNGYWAGGTNSITEGTSWIGYNMGTPVFPQEIDITARLGSDSLQVPKQAYLEGSDDGIRWTKVRRFTEYDLPAFSSGQQRQLINTNGVQPFFKDHPNYVAPNFTRNIYSTDNYRGKGMIYQAYARFNLTDVAAHVQDQIFDLKFGVFRMNGQKGSGWTWGMVEEVLYISPNLTTSGTSGWFEHTLPQPIEFEVDDYFMIIALDDDANTNPVEANEGRIHFISNWSNPDMVYPYQRHAREIDNWASNRLSSEYTIGTTNNGGSAVSSNYYRWAVDFRCQIF